MLNINFVCKKPEDVYEALDAIKNGISIVINFAGLDDESSIIVNDQICGAAYVMGADWQYVVDNEIIIVAPSNINLVTNKKEAPSPAGYEGEEGIE